MKHQNILIVVMIAIIAVSAGAVLYDVHARNASASTSTSKKTTTASKTSTASQSKTDTSTQTKPAANQKTVVLDPGHSSVMPSGSEPVGPGASETKAKDMVGTKGVATGVTEYELDHVFLGWWDGEPDPDPTESSEWRWVPADEVMRMLLEEPQTLTVWFVNVAALVLGAL